MDYSVNFFWQKLSKLLETKKLAIYHQNFTAWRKKKEKKIRDAKARNNLYSSQKIAYTINFFFPEQEQQAFDYTNL
jgi:menaquinone-dependent protoporphyrinogen IX oxidase